jgi:ubiquitin carboxyl-terminal hydrolase 1
MRRRFKNVPDEEVTKALKRGGYIGGLINDGNTCFMNSVIQSLASSKTFVDLLQDEKLTEKEFSQALKLLLQKLNTKHYKENQDYKTNPMLKTMNKTPDKNFLMGYNQEDAQEFFQTLLSELESDLKKKGEDGTSTPNKEEAIYKDQLPEDAILGNDQLGHLGKVYVPANQIDPNLKYAEQRVIPYELLTPVDGLSAERIGCLKCGEMGGIRYSVISGLSLNLPSDNYAALKLTDLLKEWIKPEIIEGVDCNRCALSHVLGYQMDQLQKLKEEDKPTSKFLVEKLEERIIQIEAELEKPIIDDEAVKKLYTKNMMRKSSKSKQIVMSRPPALLPIHINRSVFDPMTYRVRKNNARVVFPLKLDLDPFVAEPEEINTDARLPLSKKVVPDQDEQDEEVEKDKKVEQNGPAEPAEELEDLDEDLENTEEPIADGELKQDSDSCSISSASTADSLEAPPFSQEPSYNPMANDSLTGPLVYQLRSVIVHYGTHNYGHYIAYRKFRGVWWRTSDESIDIVEESEVLDAPGVFMLFYELDSLCEAVEEVDLDVEIEINEKVGEVDEIEHDEENAKDEDEAREEEHTNQAFSIASL